MEEQIELIVSCYGLLTSLGRLFIWLETLLQIGLAFGMSELCSSLVFLPNGRIGFSLSLTPPVQELLQLMELITDPQRLAVSGLIARNQAHAAIRGHTDVVETLIVKRFKMCLPRCGQAIGSPLDCKDGGALRIKSEQNGRVAGKNCIAEIQHDRLSPHRQGGREQTAITLEELAEIPYRVGRVIECFYNR